MRPIDHAPICWPCTPRKIAFNWRLQQFPNSAQVVCGLTITNSTTGVEIGNPCNKLYLGTPHLLMATATQTAFPYAIEFPVQRLWANYDKAAVGVSLITQAGYTQPQRNRFELSRAGYSYFPHQPQTIPGTKWMWASSSTAKSGSEIDGTSMPVLRLAY